MSPEESEEEINVPQSRANLVWAALVFQAKLVVDGLRDLVLVPISLIATLFGLVAGGSQPGRYFEQVLRFGRRTETWINLFDHRRGRGTSDDLISPIKDKVFQEAEANPWLQKAGTTVNRSLDQVNEAVQKRVQDPSGSSEDSVDKK